MKTVWMASAMVALTACSSGPLSDKSGTDTPAASAATSAVEAAVTPDIEPLQTVYGDDWFVSGGWPGEYPPGFSILEDNVVLAGRADMDPDLAAEITCRMPKLATYQQWNTDRVDADDLDFVSASKKYEITMTANAPIAVPADELGYSTRQIDLKAGDVLTYKRYLGEGWAIISYQGTDYEINEAELVNVSNIDSSGQAVGSGEDLWVQVTCLDSKSTRAWLLYKEAMEDPGVGPTPVIGYGEARDLTPADLIEARVLKEMQVTNEFPASG